MSLPLSSRLKKRVHLQVALIQDILVAEAFDAFPDCVLHGGTAIWRCYGGSRFSEDVDAYLTAYAEERGKLFRRALSAKGLAVVKFKVTSTTLFGRFELEGVPVSFEGALRPPPGRAVMGYETLDGRKMLVAALLADDLLVEKAGAYADRRKVRDLYDVFFLLDRVENTQKVRKALSALVRGYRPPVDEPQLKATILAGVVPSADEMLEGVRIWVARST